MRDYDSTVKNLREAAKGLLFDAMPYRASVMRDAADAIEELLADRNKALKKLCEWCGVCSEENRKALECDDIAMLDAPHWISVEERLPEPFVCVLAHIPGEKPFPTVKSAFLEKNGLWYSNGFRYNPEEVTHWCEMPAPPKGGNHDN